MNPEGASSSTMHVITALAASKHCNGKIRTTDTPANLQPHLVYEVLVASLEAGCAPESLLEAE